MIKKGDKVRVLATAWTEYQMQPFVSINDDGDLVDVNSPDEIGIQIIHDPPKKNYRNRRKKLYRAPLDKPRFGVLIGKTRRSTGYYDEGSQDDWGNYEQASLCVDKVHALWLIEPNPTDPWYRKPFTALEADLEVIE